MNKYHHFMLLILMPILVGLVLLLLFDKQDNVIWQEATLNHPLGTDEFGRDILSTLLIATGLSLAKGIFITGVTLFIAIIVAEIITMRNQPGLTFVVKLLSSIVESVPVMLWVLIGIISFSGSRLFVITLIFIIVVFPVATHLIAGEFIRLKKTYYVESAYQLGANEFRVLSYYVLPNARAVLLPYALQILGMAIAVDGAIGVIGLGNRTDLDLGIFLLRSKENFFIYPQLFIYTVAMYISIYWYIKWLENIFSKN